jgi:hypothetical protein
MLNYGIRLVFYNQSETQCQQTSKYPQDGALKKKYFISVLARAYCISMIHRHIGFNNPTITTKALQGEGKTLKWHEKTWDNHTSFHLFTIVGLVG